MEEPRETGYKAAHYHRSRQSAQRRILRRNARFTIDSSVLTKVFLKDEAFVEETRRLFESFSRGDIFLAVPPVAYHEVASNILRASRQRRLRVDAAYDAIESLIYLDLAVIDPPLRWLIPNAYVTAREQNCGLYDAIFLVVSRSIGAPLITADGPLLNSARVNFDVILIEDFDFP